MLDSLDHQVLLARPVIRVHLVHPDLKDRWVPLDHLDHQGHEVLLGLQAQQGALVIKDHRDLLDHLVNKVIEVSQDQQGALDLLDQQANQVTKDLRVVKVPLEMPDLPELLVVRGHLVSLDQRVH